MLKEINEIYPKLTFKYASIACHICYLCHDGVCEFSANCRPCARCYSSSEQIVEEEIISYISSLEV